MPGAGTASSPLPLATSRQNRGQPAALARQRGESRGRPWLSGLMNWPWATGTGPGLGSTRSLAGGYLLAIDMRIEIEQEEDGRWLTEIPGPSRRDGLRRDP